MQPNIPSASIFRYRVAMIGNPDTPDVRFDDAQLSRVKELGFTMVQLNIAWGTRPKDEALNLEDLLPLPGQAETPEIAACRAELRRRANACHAHGLRTLLHFGAPHVEKLYAQWHGAQQLERTQRVEACLLLPETTQRYQALLAALGESCPEIDDLLIYTSDQEAWLCGEFGECPRCAGVPLHERLPPFLQALRDGWARPTGTVWWEPWELSAGQTLLMAARIPAHNFGVMLHANIAEVQLANTVDRWFRNMTRACAARGIPVIGEVFLSSTNDEMHPLFFPSPRLVYQELTQLRLAPGIAGVKEYFGLLPDRDDPNLAMAGLCFADPAISLDAALQQLADPYQAAGAAMLAAWQAAADGLELFPWDVCWILRYVGTMWNWHRWEEGYRINGHLVDSPSWCSTRRAHFMTTENEELHPWFYEDMGLRCGLASEQLEQALAEYARALPDLPSARREAVKTWTRDMRTLKNNFSMLHCYILETLAARNIRMVKASGREVDATLIARLRALLQLDADNHAGEPVPEGPLCFMEILAAFDADPVGWAERHLL